MLDGKAKEDSEPLPLVCEHCKEPTAKKHYLQTYWRGGYEVSIYLCRRCWQYEQDIKDMGAY